MFNANEARNNANSLEAKKYIERKSHRTLDKIHHDIFNRSKQGYRWTLISILRGDVREYVVDTLEREGYTMRPDRNFYSFSVWW
ncbi:hypothetical protein EFL19_10275 [Weissella paramesenteroides]|nr:hypothetical protein [Weissella paramesenteroides]